MRIMRISFVKVISLHKWQSKENFAERKEWNVTRIYCVSSIFITCPFIPLQSQLIILNLVYFLTKQRTADNGQPMANVCCNLQRIVYFHYIEIQQFYEQFLFWIYTKSAIELFMFHGIVLRVKESNSVAPFFFY